MTITVRFALSPTGRLHVGNARVALINWLFAKSHGGYFVLRIDDTDRARSRAEYQEALRQDLRWLGLAWDRTIRQSERLGRYAAAAERLTADGRLYPCYETPEELAAKRQSQLERGEPPVYDRAGLKLSAAQRAGLEAAGRRPHWRFRLDRGDVRWDDLVRGPSHHQAAHLSDPVLIRADGTPLYGLSSVADDIDLAVSHVIRGEDRVANTAAQIQLFRALGAAPPQFAHLSLLTDAEGHVLSKRRGSLSLDQLRARGIDRMALNSLLAKLGTSDPVQPRYSLDALVDEFDLAHFSRAAAKFDLAELEHVNVRLLHGMPFAEAAARLAQLGIDDGEAFWLAVRANLQHVDEARDWWHICREPVVPVIEDASFARQAADLLPPEPWSADSWQAWTAAVEARTGRKGRALFHPLRLALTGRENGPELKTLLPLIGRSRAVRRLCGETA